MRVAVVGNIQSNTTQRSPSAACLSPTLTSTPKATAPSCLYRMQGPDHYRTSPVSITSLAQWEHSTQPPGFRPRKRRHSAFGSFTARICDVPRPPSQKSFKHLCREEIKWTGLHSSTDSAMPMAEAAICCLKITPIPLPLRLCSKTTKPGNTSLDQISCGGNAAILARSHTCAAGMALKIHDVERAFPVRLLVRRYLRRQAFTLPTRLRFIEGSLARRNSNGVSTAGTRVRSNSDGRWFKLGIRWRTPTSRTNLR